MQVFLNLLNGQRIAFDVSCDLHGPAYFVLSVRKCGSTIFNQICGAIAHTNRRHFVPVGDTFFWNNVRARDYVNDPALLDLPRPGNVFGAFRDMPKILLNSELFRAGRKLLMVRDPRDALVSEFFSNAFSHPLPPESSTGTGVTKLLLRQREAALGEGIDATVIRSARPMCRTMLEYAPIMELADTAVLKYEDYILDKRALIGAITCAFGWTINEAQTSQILSWADVRPERENPTAFVRRVTPGDHREKLNPQTIAKLDKTLRPAMELFGYSP